MSITTSQNDFEGKRALALIYLKAMITVSRRLNNLSNHDGFREHIHKLSGLESKLKGAMKPNLQDQNLEHITNFRDYLLAHRKFGNKMNQYYLVVKEYAKAAYDPTKEVTIEPKIVDAIKRFSDVDTLTTDIYAELLKNLNNHNSAIGILYVTGCIVLWIAKRESFGYFVMSILKKTKIQSVLDRL